jgi:lysophospholipase L1-like esterase
LIAEAEGGMNIVCFGDSITEGAEFAESQRWPSLLQAHLDRWRPGAFVVHNRGVGGDTTARAFDRLESDVLPLLPGVLLVQFGFNDANVRDWAHVPRVGLTEFQKNLHEFHRLGNTQGGECVFIVNHTIGAVPGRQGNGKSYNENFEPYNRTVGALARELGALAIDLPRMMQQRLVDLGDFLAVDRLHLSRAGNHQYAAMLFEGLSQIMDSQRSPANLARR